MTLADTNGLLTASATGRGSVSGAGTKSLSLGGTPSQIATILGALKDTGSTEHSDERQIRLPRRSRMVLATDRPFGKLSPNEPAFEQGENLLEWDCSHSSRSSSGRMVFGRGIGGGFGSGAHEYNEAIGCASQHGANGHGSVRARL
jgi:hypothetical protein